MIRNVSNLDHKFYINDPHIRKCFPLLERGLLRASRLIKCGCGKFEYSFVDDLLKQNIIFSEQEKEDLKYKCALINILESLTKQELLSLIFIIYLCCSYLTIYPLIHCLFFYLFFLNFADSCTWCTSS